MYISLIVTVGWSSFSYGYWPGFLFCDLYLITVQFSSSYIFYMHSRHCLPSRELLFHVLMLLLDKHALKVVPFLNLFLSDLCCMSYFRNLFLPQVYKYILYFLVKFKNFAFSHLSLYNLPGIYIYVRYSYLLWRRNPLFSLFW